MRVFLCDVGNIPQDVLKKAAKLLPKSRVPREGIHEAAYTARVVGTLLAHYAIKQLSPEAVCESWQIAAGGKPFIKSCPVHFSISHTEGIVGVAVSAEHPTGLDAEQIRPMHKDFAARYFSETEQALIRDAIDRDETLIRLWTAKEAVAKYHGTGLKEIPAIDTQNAVMTVFESNGARFALSVSPGGDMPALEWVDFEDLIP